MGLLALRKILRYFSAVCLNAPNGPSLKLLNLVERNGLEILALTPSPPSKARGFTANLIKISFLKRVKKTALFLTRYATHVKEMAVFLTCLLFVQC